MVVAPEDVTDAGLNDGVTPAGNPVTVNDTTPLNPEPPVTVAVYPALPPCVIVCDAGVAESPKSGTVIVRVAATLVSPPESLTVNDATYVPGAA
jgi:hypothetical protein